MTKHYIETCRRLGFRPEIRFVDIKRNGAIGFTAGKPDEIRALGTAVRRAGLRMSTGLRRRLETL